MTCLRCRGLRAHLPVALLAAATMFAPRVHAQDQGLEALLDQAVVSTPTKSAETSTDAPATSSIVTAEDLRAHGLRSLDEAINFIALGMVTTQSEHAVEIGARGVLLTSDYGNHVLLLIDGVPANEPWNGTAYFERGMGVPMELVDHIEVTLGPGSVMYGGQAMLGVVNVVTKRATDYAGWHAIVEGDTSAPVTADGSLTLSPLDAFGRGYRLGAGIGHRFEVGTLPAELTLQLELYRHRGPHWSLTPQDRGNDSTTGQPFDFGPRAQPGVWGGTATRSNYADVPAAYGRLRIGDFDATLRAGMYRRASPYTDGIVNTGDDFDDPNNGERDRWIQLSVGYHRALSTNVSASARLYGLLNEYLWTSRRSAADECPEGFDRGCTRELTGVGISGGSDLQLNVAEPAMRGATTLGLDVRVRHAGSDYDIHDRITGALDPVGNDYARTDALVAPYLQQSLTPFDGVDVNVGLRLDYDTRFGAKVSPRAAVGLDLWKGGRLKGIYSEAFRAPTAYELNYADPNDQIASPHLGAEDVHSLELSLEQRFGTHRLFFGVFRTWWHDVVTFRSLSEDEVAEQIELGALNATASEGYVYANAGSIESYGYNASYDARVAERLRMGLTVTAAYSRIDFGGGDGAQPLTVSPSLFGNAHASYDLGNELPTLALAARLVAQRPADRAFDGGFAKAPYAPTDVQLRLTLSGQVPGVSALRYRLSGTYATAAVGAYVIGPNQYAEDATTPAALSPQRRLSAFLGFEYVLE